MYVKVHLASAVIPVGWRMSVLHRGTCERAERLGNGMVYWTDTEKEESPLLNFCRGGLAASFP